MAPQGEIGMMPERSIDGERIRIEQQLRDIETVAVFRLPWPLGAEAIACAGAHSAHETIVKVAQPLRQRLDRHYLTLSALAEEHARGIARDDGDIDAALCQPHAGWRCHRNA